jgi:hypothetical protein
MYEISQVSISNSMYEISHAVSAAVLYPTVSKPLIPKPDTGYDQEPSTPYVFLHYLFVFSIVLELLITNLPRQFFKTIFSAFVLFPILAIYVLALLICYLALCNVFVVFVVVLLPLLCSSSSVVVVVTTVVTVVALVLELVLILLLLVVVVVVVFLLLVVVVVAVVVR